MTGMHGTVHWTELMTRDIDAAKAYYAEVCGWTYDGMDMGPEGGTYWVARRGGDMVAGLMDMTGHEAMSGIPAHWLTYLAVDDVDAAVVRTRALDGTVHRDSFDVAGVGRIAIVADPTGAAIGLMTPEPAPA